jgi:hypothetical protein
MVLLLTACGSPSEDAACEKLYEDIISPVDGVESVEVDCSSQFGGGWRRVSVHLAAADKEEMAPLRENVERALAEDPDIDPGWYSPSRYVLEDGTEVAVGTSTVESLRQEYGIQP